MRDGASAGEAAGLGVVAGAATFAGRSLGELWVLGGLAESDGEGDGARNRKIAAARGETSGELEGGEALNVTWV